MNWNIYYWIEAKKDLKKLEKSKQEMVKKAIDKVSQNPLPNSEEGYGKPLGNRNGMNLTGYYKIKLRDAGIRIIYKLERTARGMEIVIIGIRDSAEIYDLAIERIKKRNQEEIYDSCMLWTL